MIIADQWIHYPGLKIHKHVQKIANEEAFEIQRHLFR